MKRVISKVFLAFALVVLAVLPVKDVKADEFIQVNKEYTYTNTVDRSVEKTVKFKAPANGYFTVIDDEKAYQKLLIYDQYNTRLAEKWEDSKDSFGYTKAVIPAAKNDVFTIVFTVPRGKYIPSTGEEIAGKNKIYVDFHISNDWEREPNDKKKNATTLTNKKYKYGILSGDLNTDKEDFYKFKLKKDSEVTFTFGPKSAEGVNNLSLSLEGPKFDMKMFKLNGLHEGHVSVYLRKGTYYAKVAGAKLLPYKLKYSADSFKVAKPTIKKVKPGKKNGKSSTRPFGTISLKMKGDVEGYEVQIAKKKNMKSKVTLTKGLAEKVFTDSKNSDTKSTIKRFSGYNLKRGTYYVRVRGFVNTRIDTPTFNFTSLDKIYGSWSKVYKVKL